MRSFSRRDLMRFAALAGLGFSQAKTQTSPKLGLNPFGLGVASGDPSPDGMVLWTRLLGDDSDGAGTGLGLPFEAIQVDWVLAHDEQLKRIVQRGSSFAVPELAHSVHVEVVGLEPDREYWYRFRVAGFESTIGRTRTAPAFDSRPTQLQLAFASCANYQHGFFGAYRAMAEEDLDLVLFLGDYIYESGTLADYERVLGFEPVRLHNGPTLRTLADYRRRYALYKSDPDLQQAHARAPWVVTWDDHELEDNYANDFSRHGTPKEELLRRRRAAYQAYFEHMPLRNQSLPQGLQLALYRRLRYGDLASFHVLDTRQYRSVQACGDLTLQFNCRNPDPNQTLLGSDQERWLTGGLDRAGTKWNFLAQQVMMAQFHFLSQPLEAVNNDDWNGYPLARDRLLGFLGARKPGNPVVLSGDIHSSWVHDLKVNFDDPKSVVVGTEFVGTSITSKFPQAGVGLVQAALSHNPHTKFFNGREHGYTHIRLSRHTLRATERVIDTQDPKAEVRTGSSWVVVDGVPGVQG